jgi:hypothetical protein
VVRPAILTLTFGAWTAACAIAAVWMRRAPAVTLALVGAVIGGVVGFVIGDADGPAQAPSFAAGGASVGAFLNGLVAIALTAPRPPSRSLRRAAAIVAALTPIGVIAIAALVQLACPLYVTGRGTGWCNYRDADVLGGWASEVVALFALDAVLIVGLLLASARQALRAEDAEDDWLERRAAARTADTPPA